MLIYSKLRYMKVKALSPLILLIFFVQCSSSVSPGLFLGRWWEAPGVSHNCIAKVYKADSLLEMSIINKSTHETLTLKGRIGYTIDVPISGHLFTVFDSSNTRSGIVEFTKCGDNFDFRQVGGNDHAMISCYRKPSISYLMNTFRNMMRGFY
jgi:hypothetical protein